MHWDTRFAGLAEDIASWSKDPSTQVGCVIVGADREILTTGFNGLPRGVQDLPERLKRPAKYLWTAHSEANAIYHAARRLLKGSTAYVTHCPCASCAGALIQAGVSRVVFGGGLTSMPEEQFVIAHKMLNEAGVEIDSV